MPNSKLSQIGWITQNNGCRCKKCRAKIARETLLNDSDIILPLFFIADYIFVKFRDIVSMLLDEIITSI
jgi:hypothetical protein